MAWQTEADAASDIIETMSRISLMAKNESERSQKTIPVDFNHPQHARHDFNRRLSEIQGASQLISEPLITALQVETETAERRIYYFSRRSRVDGAAPYHTHTLSRIGSLSVCEPDDEYELPDGSIVTVLSRFALTPRQDHSGWDSRPTNVAWRTTPRRLLASIRELMRIAPTEADAWAVFESEDIVKHTSSRDVLRGTGLRDQANLDKSQDRIFRLPISSQIMVSGAPGSGKTTTLIRRIAQKTEFEFLDDAERLMVDQRGHTAHTHKSSWLMFTPTELLQGYIANAFGLNGVAASTEQLWTWTSFSLTLGRDEFGILKKANNRSGLTLNRDATILTTETEAAPWEWISEFEGWLESEQKRETGIAREALLASSNVDLQVASARSSANGDKDGSLLDINMRIQEQVGSMLDWAGPRRSYWRDLLDRRIDRFGRMNIQNIQTLARLTDEIGTHQSDTDQDDDARDDDDEVGGEQLTSRNRKDQILLSVRRSLAAVARARVRGRATPERYKRLLEFTREEILTHDEIVDYGKELELLRQVNRLSQADNNLFRSIPRRYRAFRRDHAKWYLKLEPRSDIIVQAELDMLIFVALKAASQRTALHEEQNTFWAESRKIAASFRNQVFVDEATDFSPVQLAAMGHLSHPRFRSIFLSGDFDQRLSVDGVKDERELINALPSIQIARLGTGYRQSRQLANFTKLLRRVWLGLPSGDDPLEPEVGSFDGLPPAVFEARGDAEAEADWIADRVAEIDTVSDKLPSIAILAPSSDYAKALAETLSQRLPNISVAAHTETGNIGRDEELRVFPIQHVKGLEFEAAFFVGVDQLERDHPSNFERYLYVGATRAATFLAFTASDRLPTQFAEIRDVMRSNWG